MKKKKVANMLLLNYLLLFIFSTIIFIIVSLIISVSFKGLIKHDEIPELSASQIMRDDYENIDFSQVLKYKGGVQVIDKNYKVVFSRGINPKNIEQYTKSEFSEFLINSGKHQEEYYYNVRYNNNGDFWLKIVIPIKTQFVNGIFFDKNGIPRAIDNFIFILILGGLINITSFILGLIIYSRLTSNNFVKPLKKLLSGVTTIAGGDYSARVDLRSTNEFGELKDAFNIMAEKIESEKNLKEKSQDNRRKLILDISHDLKTPLSNIMGYSDLLMNNKDISDCDREKFLGIIINNSSRANSLIGDLFELSKMGSSDFKLNLKSVDICEYLRELIASLIPQIEEAGFKYSFEIPFDKKVVLIDVKQMDRALINILNNALKYNKRGTEIKILLKNSFNKVVLEILDNGIGIPLDLSAEIFEPFKRVDSARNSQTGGTGLGLAITKTIIEKHNGRISLETAIGKGCKFIIKLE
ncbi:HAMP domain-containing histidine kinase [Clostridium sp. CM028]|uniref:sensor histidine kinase n=1 Tax=unclassified Clostridium TaxID=2614128 RepID=UPI001C0C315C|nr:MULTISPECIES: HAMP domain-containing sensor histidine kinase [unclassified Clostridium]MBU3092164.1 HAMP domain-containing histidine kinase [Clostridium sp. CF011]MBW9146474.1 HAMP domain-containing histidine kinase [Clostridium sp. CM027]MBW9149134.1 HAMP domain-containing histidine kinase [Clostridium sp. CM028]UVE41974.1 HAMP domain-containing histidine kinase [Clostridium sp. CM027]WAG70994.1 HAMP domain-containing histidine kinase [Clostridium sp. CF011]